MGNKMHFLSKSLTGTEDASAEPELKKNEDQAKVAGEEPSSVSAQEPVERSFPWIF